MLDGSISPAQPDRNIPGQSARLWEQGSHAPEVAYTLQEQCDDDYFLTVKSRSENAMMKIMRSVARYCAESAARLMHDIANLFH